MAQFTKNLKQTATYWLQTGTDITGAGVFSAPEAKRCRWEDTQELFIDKTGQERTSKAKVFFDGPVDLEGYLFLGTSGQSNPAILSGAREIRQIKTIPDLRAIQTLYVAFL